jgi:hypothetical protein
MAQRNSNVCRNATAAFGITVVLAGGLFQAGFVWLGVSASILAVVSGITAFVIAME